MAQEDTGASPAPESHVSWPEWLLLTGALAALAARFAWIGDASLNYDEATYVDLAQRPWRSDYYPDAWFVRHPPLYFLVMALWTRVFGDAELVARLPGFLFTAAGLLLAWAGARTHGRAAAATTISLLATSYLVIFYGVQATMYPLAFGLGALAYYAHVTGRGTLLRTAIVLLALTHLFGFLFLAVHVWSGRKEVRRELPTLALPLVWLIAAAIGAIALRNPAGPALGPTWQVLRVFAAFFETFVDPRQGAIHFASFLVGVLLLNPDVLARLWTYRRTWTPWVLGNALLVPFLMTGPSFLRYGIVPLPTLAAAGSALLPTTTRRVAAVLVGVAATLTAHSFTTSGLDPVSGNDLPGIIEWDEAAAETDALGVDEVGTPATTALAHYLVRGHGHRVVDASLGPGTLVLERPNGTQMRLHELPSPERISDAALEQALVIVPDSWDIRDELEQKGYENCGPVHGATLFVAPAARKCA